MKLKYIMKEKEKKDEKNLEKEKEELYNQIQKLTQNLNNEKLNTKNIKDELNKVKSDSKYNDFFIILFLNTRYKSFIN